MTVALAAISLASALAAIAAMAGWAVRERFDPFDSWLLAIAAYLGCLIVAGFVLNALPGGLSRPLMFTAVLVGGLVGAAVLTLVCRPRLARLRRPQRPLVSSLVALVVVASLSGLAAAVWFARATEVRALEPHALAAYVDEDAETMSVHNPTKAVRSFVLTQRLAGTGTSSPGVTVALRPGQTWRAPTLSAGGRTVVTVSPSSGRPIDLILVDEVPDVANARITTGW